MQSETEDTIGSPSEDRPELSVCKSAPGKAVFIESKNSDGWIAIDAPVEVIR
jgi:hypothetical protein